MSIRSKWCDPDKETRKYILKRDKQCIFCGNREALTLVHVFLSRANGGKGSKENIVAGCTKCHYFVLDNPLGNKNNVKSQQMLEYAKKYLIDKESIVYNKEFIETLKYHKELGSTVSLFQMPEKTFGVGYINNNKDITIKKCKSCELLVKNKYNNSTIPTYYCKYKKILLNKSTKACDKYKEVIR